MSAALHIWLPAESATEQVLDQIDALLSEWPGDHEVIMHLSKDGKVFPMRSRRFRVCAGPIASDLSGLVDGVVARWGRM
jgi:hypothetical protein